jgi:hypothetical protein
LDIIDNLLAYVLTMVGIVASNYIPMIKTNGHIDFTVDVWRLGISAIVALIIVGKQETVSPDEMGNTEKSRAGRRKNFVPRMANAVAQGIAWNTIMQMA